MPSTLPAFSATANSAITGLQTVAGASIGGGDQWHDGNRCNRNLFNNGDFGLDHNHLDECCFTPFGLRIASIIGYTRRKHACLCWTGFWLDKPDNGDLELLDVRNRGQRLLLSKPSKAQPRLGNLQLGRTVSQYSYLTPAYQQSATTTQAI